MLAYDGVHDMLLLQYQFKTSDLQNSIIFYLQGEDDFM